jgi:hypothetical protein
MTDIVEKPKKDNRQEYLKELFLANPTAILSLMYLYVTAIGMLYSFLLYRNFEISIFDYSEIGDFLLAAFKNPIAFLSGGFLAAIGVVWWLRRESVLRRTLGEYETAEREYVADVAEIERRKYEAMERGSEVVRESEARRPDADEINESYQRQVDGVRTHERRRRIVTAIIFTLSSVWISFIPPIYSATRTASAIKQEQTPAVDVRYRSFSGSEGQVTEPDLMFVGATQKVAFFYDVNAKRTIVIPQAQIVSIEVPD